MQRHFFLCLLALAAFATRGVAAPAQPVSPSPRPESNPQSPIVEDGDSVRIGDKITITKSRRTLSYPAWVNQQRGVIEYAIVMRAGKTHESLFATDIDAKDLHVAALLLGVKPEDIITRPNESWNVPSAQALSIQASWKTNDTEKSYPLTDLVILHDPKQERPDQKFPSTNWWYNGSRVIEGGAFVAQTGGSIVSVIFDPDALINNPGIDRLDDDIHFIKDDVVPAVNTPVTITFQFPKASAEEKKGKEADPKAEVK